MLDKGHSNNFIILFLTRTISCKSSFRLEAWTIHNLNYIEIQFFNRRIKGDKDQTVDHLDVIEALISYQTTKYPKS